MCRRLAPIALALALLPGCGGGDEVRVTGSLLQGGAPYKPPEGQGVTLALVAIEFVDAAGKTVKRPDTHQAALDPSDGSFRVPGPEGRGIPPGKYRVSLTRRHTREAFEALKGKPKGMQRDDLFQDRFGPTTSPIVREVRPGSPLLIDLDKPTEGAPGVP